jgi:hypothetical protein
MINTTNKPYYTSIPTAELQVFRNQVSDVTSLFQAYLDNYDNTNKAYTSFKQVNKALIEHFGIDTYDIEIDTAVAPVGLILEKLKLIASYKAARILINELAVSLVTLEEERVAPAE